MFYSHIKLDWLVKPDHILMVKTCVYIYIQFNIHLRERERDKPDESRKYGTAEMPNKTIATVFWNFFC